MRKVPTFGPIGVACITNPWTFRDECQRRLPSEGAHSGKKGTQDLFCWMRRLIVSGNMRACWSCVYLSVKFISRKPPTCGGSRSPPSSPLPPRLTSSLRLRSSHHCALSRAPFRHSQTSPKLCLVSRVTGGVFGYFNHANLTVLFTQNFSFTFDQVYNFCI